ncbi:MAG: tRNA (adenosine(37)-N6)-threonylcarbamoyltransferase complex transferase subunit TsaD [Candidatus Aminicenantes bacterium]|nr:tRNA (adenosine(37)-N6)-threonylcarbamoyltransferase complex transferase subunit TsaD [Candidatus Aminicenantes bacterium]
MRLLAIETSCDETSAAVLTGPGEVLSNVVLSQDEVHAPYGGVVPELASREHLKSIDLVVAESLTAAGVRVSEIDAFAVTQGPGLVGSLVVGISFAKGLAYYFRKPLIGVDHLQAHIQAAFLERPGLPYPVLALVVSGGHTSAFLLKEPFRYDLLARTRDDAAGEALDKIAKFLGLGYPGGPVIERLARGGNPKRFPFALPKMTDRSLDFSFSGLKTAALRLIREEGVAKDSPAFSDFLASFEEAVVRAVMVKLERMAEAFGPRALVLSGGVARNARLRSRFAAFAAANGFEAVVPSPRLCTDNAAMVGSLAAARLARGRESFRSLDLNAYPR